MSKLSKVELIKIAEKVNQECIDGTYLGNHSIPKPTPNDYVKFDPIASYDVEVIPKGRQSECVLVDSQTLDALLNLTSADQKVALLNFSDSKKIGGLWLRGGDVQEESLVRRSNLYQFQLQNKDDFYLEYKQHPYGFGTNSFLLSHDVFFYKDSNDDYLDEPRVADVITSAAINLRYYKDSKWGIQSQSRLRINHFLKHLNNSYNFDVLILGAFGCGIFKNDPSMIASIFNDALQKDFIFPATKVIFAIPNAKSKNYQAFKKYFKEM